MVKLAADVHERALPYAGGDRVEAALSRDPALRSLPSDELARRFGVTRRAAEGAIEHMVRHHAGVFVQVSGRSFDEAIADVGHSRRPALSPEPINEAAGAMRRFRGPPGRMSRRMGYDARGYQTPPIPDLASILLSDAFPCTRRHWSQSSQPSLDEMVILNWQHPLAVNASSVQSLATIKALSLGCRSWDTAVTVGGNSITPRNDQERANYWSELQQILNARSTGNVINRQGLPVDWGPGLLGLAAPILGDVYTEIEWLDLSDPNHPRIKHTIWSNGMLQKLGSSQSVLAATWAGHGAVWQMRVDGADVIIDEPGYDAEMDFMKAFAGLGGIINSLVTAVSSAVAVYCPACSVAIKMAGNIAVTAANNAVTTKALANFGDAMLKDAQTGAMGGDPSRANGLKAFAGALIGLPHTSQPTFAAVGGIVADYLASLNHASGNVPAALFYYATDHSNQIGSSADLAKLAKIPYLDCVYAVAAMTDTLARFSTNVGTAYENGSLMWKIQHGNIAIHNSLPVPKSLGNLPMIPGTYPPPPSQSSGAAPVAIAAGVGLAWYFGLLKGIL